MKKILKNKKGFTLVELLAVIVVLAIIMVIATQSIGGIIKKNTVDSFKSSLDIVAKSGKTAYLQYGNTVTANQIAGYVDYDKTQFTISLDNADKTKVCITSVAGGKFDEMDKTIFSTWSDWSFDDTTKQTTACKKYR